MRFRHMRNSLGHLNGKTHRFGGGGANGLNGLGIFQKEVSKYLWT